MNFLKVSLLLTMVLLGSLCPKKPEPQQAPIKIRSQQLMYEYVPNLQAAGDAKYKGKELLVKGKIVKALPEEGIVVLEGIPAAITYVVICHFQDDITREAIRQSFDDQEIIVQGTNTGWQDQGVHLRPCRLRTDVK